VVNIYVFLNLYSQFEFDVPGRIREMGTLTAAKLVIRKIADINIESNKLADSVNVVLNRQDSLTR
jgi:hypothetical protein